MRLYIYNSKIFIHAATYNMNTTSIVPSQSVISQRKCIKNKPISTRHARWKCSSPIPLIWPCPPEPPHPQTGSDPARGQSYCFVSPWTARSHGQTPRARAPWQSASVRRHLRRRTAPAPTAPPPRPSRRPKCRVHRRWPIWWRWLRREGNEGMYSWHACKGLNCSLNIFWVAGETEVGTWPVAPVIEWSILECCVPGVDIFSGLLTQADADKMKPSVRVSCKAVHP